MKKLFITAIYLIAIIFTSKSQDIPLAKQDDFQKFIKSTTYLVEYGNPFSSFNKFIAEDMKKVWKITPYKVISENEFENLRKEKEKSFIFLSEAAKEEDKNYFKLNILNFVLGSKGTLNSMPDLGSAPLSYVFENSDDENTYLYKLCGILRFFQYYVNYNLSHPESDIKAIVKENKKIVKEKELWLLKDEMGNEVKTEEAISKFYTGKVKFVTQDEIRKAILEGNTNVAFLHKVGPGTNTGNKCLKILISAADGAPLYMDLSTVNSKNSDAFHSSDFKSIN